MDPNTDQNKPKKIGLALSGGGIRGVSHVGVLQALTDHGIRFSHISGTSAGAVAGVFFAEGYTPQQMLALIKETRLIKLIRPSLFTAGLLSTLHAQALFKQYIPHNTFSKLKILFTAAAVDVGEGKLVYFTDGDLDISVLASASIPGIFKPITINGHIYIDGGILNNLPVEPLIGNCDLIIGSSCNHMPYVNHIDGILELMDRAAMITINASLNNHKLLCDVVIEPHGLGGYGMFDTDAIDEIYMIGYEEGLKAIETNEILKAVVQTKSKRKKAR